MTALVNLRPEKWFVTQIKDGFNKSQKLQETEAQRVISELGLECMTDGGTFPMLKILGEHHYVNVHIINANA